MTDTDSLIVQLGSAQRAFAPDRPVRIGRAPELDITLDHPLVSREHGELSWHDGGWYLTDTMSTNGVFVGGQRVDRYLRIDRPLEVRFGDPATGPALTLMPARQGTVAPPPATAARLPAGTVTIGRTADNDIVIDDMLASRHHARLVAGSHGLAIEDLGSINGTYVNGVRVQRSLLREGDIVTIGNVDAIARGGTLQYLDRSREATGLRVHGVGFVVEGDKPLLIDVHLSAQPGTLVALIGPSGAGKSTLARLVAGSTNPSSGAVSFDGHDVHAEYDALRSRIGMVPQDDVLHRQLTVRQALGYAAELRLPPDVSADDRANVIGGVVAELGLTEHADTRVDRLSGGQRKRASVALELLTGPSLLILDEPTSGLDPALDRQVMTMLRELADAGRVVVVVTHSLTYLSLCDQVLLLAPGGKTAYCGAPSGVGAALGSSDWAEIFTHVTVDPDGVFARYRAANPHPPPEPAAPHGPHGNPAHTSVGRQISTVARRQVRLVLADRGYLVFLVLLPFVLGALSLVVPGKAGFGAAGPDAPTEPQQVLVLLILGACFMGLSLTVRDLVGERTIFRRERAVGLVPSAYLLAKVVVFCVAALLQSAVLVAIVFVGKGTPGPGALIGSGAAELYLDIALTACSCVMIGLALSALARSSEQVMPLLVVTIMAQLVMCGGLIPVTDRLVLDQLSWLFTARWGFAASASTIDLRNLVFAVPGQAPPVQQDRLWQHLPEIWLLNVTMLVVLGVVFGVVTLVRLRRT